jgi:hypothetical protein
MRAHGNTARAEKVAQGVAFGDDTGEIYFDPLTMQAKPYNIFMFSLYPEALTKRCGSAGVWTVPACEPGMRVSKPLVIPSIARSAFVDALDGRIKTDGIQGEKFAEDLLRPLMAGTRESIWSSGNNWDEFGVFWTVNEVPTDEEIAKARQKLEKMYQTALAEATDMESKGQTGFTPLMRHAATYFDQDRPWNRTFKKRTECPGCGEPVKEGIILHPACGYIFDRERYDASIATKKPKTI